MVLNYAQALHSMTRQTRAGKYAQHRMSDAAWRRSAIEFVPQLVATCPDPAAQHAAVLQEIANEVERIDEALLDALLDGPILTAPEGVPKCHWWWWV